MINKKSIITTLTIVATLLAILGGFWAFEDRYAKSAEVKDMEVQVVQTLKQFNMQQMKVIQLNEYKNQYRFYQFLYDKLGQDLLEIRRQLRRYPEDQILRQDYVDVKEQRDGVKEKMNELMEKIK